MQAHKDQNTIPSALGVSSVDNVTPIVVRVDPVTNYVLADMTSDSITITPAVRDKRDENEVPTVYGVSNDDSITLLPIRTDEDGRLLCQIT